MNREAEERIVALGEELRKIAIDNGNLYIMVSAGQGVRPGESVNMIDVYNSPQDKAFGFLKIYRGEK